MPNDYRGTHVFDDPLDREGVGSEPPIRVDGSTVQEPDWFEKFRYDLYDWEDPEFKRKNRGRFAYQPIRLNVVRKSRGKSEGFCMLVSRHDYQRMTICPNGSPKTWYAKIVRDEEGRILQVYARRHGRSGEPKYVYAHRELIGCLDEAGVVVDHKNGWSLDNRRGTPKKPVNLHGTDHRENGHNRTGTRRKNLHLPSGVEQRGKKYGGIFSKRSSGNRVATIRSKRLWKTPEPAAKWYQNQLKKMHGGRKAWAHNPPSGNYPIFPPRLDAELSGRSLKLRAILKTSLALEHAEAPF